MPSPPPTVAPGVVFAGGCEAEASSETTQSQSRFRKSLRTRPAHPLPTTQADPCAPGSGRAPGSAWGAWLCLIGVPQEVAAGPPAALEDDKLQSPGAHGAAGVPLGDAGACSWPPRGSPVRMLVSSTAGGGGTQQEVPTASPTRGLSPGEGQHSPGDVTAASWCHSLGPPRPPWMSRRLTFRGLKGSHSSARGQ